MNAYEEHRSAERQYADDMRRDTFRYSEENTFRYFERNEIMPEYPANKEKGKRDEKLAGHI